MGCCNNTPAKATTLDLSGYPTLMVFPHLLDMFTYIPELRLNSLERSVARFTVEHQVIDINTYMFMITDTLTNEMVSYSVIKTEPLETPALAFARDFRKRELWYNRSVKRALEDLVEALMQDNVSINYQLVHTTTGWQIIRILDAKNTVVVFQVVYAIVAAPAPIVDTTLPLIGFDHIPGEVGQTLERLVKRFQKLAVSFESLLTATIHNYSRSTLVGYTTLTDDTHMRIEIIHHDMTMSDDEIRQYHTYYSN